MLRRSLPDIPLGQRWNTSMKSSILAGLIALSLTAGIAQAAGSAYQTPPHNYYQNNWMKG